MTALWVLMWVLVGLLLAFTTYAAVVGIVGVFAGSGYERCPRCGHHYLSGPGEQHECSQGIQARVLHAGRGLSHLAAHAVHSGRPTA